MFQNPSSALKKQSSKVRNSSSRKKYEEIKAQHPGMPQKVIVGMSLMELEKSQEKSSYVNKKSTNAKNGKLSTGLVASSKRKDLRKIQEQQVMKIVPRNLDFNDEAKPNSDSSIKELSESGAKALSEQSDSMKINKTKSIKKAKKIKETQPQRKKFFKFYFERLRSEHPKWSSPQITNIIALLWKKKISDSSGKRLSSVVKKRIMKQVGPRVAFRLSKTGQNLDLNQIKKRWAILPAESKKYWKAVGQTYEDKCVKPKSANPCKVIRFNHTFEKIINVNQNKSNLSFMRNHM